jgi:hypothetical protein
MSKPFRDGQRWEEWELMILILSPMNIHQKIAEFLGRTEASIRMKWNSLLHIYAKRGKLVEMGLSSHSETDLHFVLKGYCELACDDFKKMLVYRSLKNLKKKSS